MQSGDILRFVGCVFTIVAAGWGQDDVWKRLFEEAYKLDSEGRFAEAYLQSRKALQETERFDPSDIRIAMTLNRIGISAMNLGRYPEAERAFSRGIRLMEGTQTNRFELATLLGNLGSVYFLEGNRFRQAERLKRQALDLTLTVFGPGEPAAGNMFMGLAILEMQNHRSAEAQLLLERAVAALETAPPEYAGHLAAAFHNSASLAVSMGRYSQAIAPYQRAIALFEQNLGASHPHLTLPLTGLAAVYIKINQARLALPLLQRALVLAESSYDQDHPVLAKILSLYASALDRLGRRRESQLMASRAATVAALRRAKVDIIDLNAPQ